MLQNFFSNKNIYKKLKLRLKNTLIEKTLMYASEMWILTERDKKKITIFERRVYRRILDLGYDTEKENCRILTIKNFRQWFKNPLKKKQ
jgi:hypothetical protein